MVETTASYYKKFPYLFEKWTNLRENLLKRLDYDHKYFKEHRELAKAIYNDTNMSKIPHEIQSVIKEEPSREELMTSSHNRHPVEKLSNSFSKMKFNDNSAEESITPT